jgi:hypothetical protein
MLCLAALPEQPRLVLLTKSIGLESLFHCFLYLFILCTHCINPTLHLPPLTARLLPAYLSRPKSDRKDNPSFLSNVC